ncbi:uncharacterized protein CDAR_33611 [Caerostris darwini]|uniref:Uncharacterized protein n=1 Tax=Caerostris darwini TaxID=1538125 RepID=A0AAV4S4H7_9ARAC|nr:uncharacterized protein CDAR_33611 [Caerostris darwini]
MMEKTLEHSLENVTMCLTKMGYWHNLSICTEEDETPIPPEYPEPFKDKKKKKKTSMLQRALSERTRSRRLNYQADANLSPQRFPHRSNNSEIMPEYRHLMNSPADGSALPSVVEWVSLYTPEGDMNFQFSSLDEIRTDVFGSITQIPNYQTDQDICSLVKKSIANIHSEKESQNE